MRVSIPHTLPKEDVKERLSSRLPEIGNQLPGGASVDINWADEYQMNMVITAMQQVLRGQVEIKESEVAIELNLPPALAFVEGILGPMLQEKGAKLLEAS